MIEAEVMFHHISLYGFNAKNRTQRDISSLGHPLPRFAITLGIKCHCFDTIAQTQKWLLKGDRAISLLLNLWGWRGPACLSEQKRRWWQGLTPPSKFIFNSDTQTHTSSRGKKKKSQREAKHLYEQWLFSQLAQKLSHKTWDFAPRS